MDEADRPEVVASAGSERLSIAERRAQWTADVVLNDGGTVHVRPIEPADAAALQGFHSRQSSESQYYRYFSAKARLTDVEAGRFSDVDLVDRGALVVEEGDEMVAWASYERFSGRDDADVAFHVDGAQQGRGMATLLLEHLGAMARAAGIRRFTAEVLADNRPMLAVFARTGWPLDRHFDSGIVDFVWPIDDTAEFVANVSRREQVADSRSMARFLLPRSVAVIGASARVGSVGRTLLEHALLGAPRVPVHAVNPHHTELLGLPCVSSIEDVDADIGLAVVAVPPGVLAEVLLACARRRVRGAIVVTEVPDGFPVDALIADVRRSGMRVVGPGSMGVAVPGSSPPLHAHLAPPTIPAGPLAVSLQSGSLGASVLERASRLGIGISSFVSLGDRADVSGNDLLQFWQDDASTRVIAMYTESVGNPRRFARIARRVSLTRPIVAVRPWSHAFDDALHQQAGVIRVDTVGEMLDTARVLATQPCPSGARIGVVTDSAGPARLLLAGLQAVGLHAVGPGGARGEWQQLAWSVDAASFAAAVEARRGDGTCDAVVAVHAPPVAPTDESFAREIAALIAPAGEVPVLAVLLGQRDGPIAPGSAIPNFSFPDDVARVLGRCVRYARWRDAELTLAGAGGRPVGPATDPRAGEIIAEALVRRPGGTMLPMEPMAAFLEAIGVRFAPARAVASCEAAVIAAEGLGYPVVLKAEAGRRRGHGRDVGAALDLRDARAVRVAWARLDGEIGGLREAMVQVVVPSGIECRIHGTVHPTLGPAVSFGLGGVFADPLADQIVRLAPFGDDAAGEMLDESRAGDVIADLGGAAPETRAMIAAVAEAIDRHPDLAEVDLNPLIVSPGACWVTDAVVRIRPPVTPDPAMRRL